MSGHRGLLGVDEMFHHEATAGSLRRGKLINEISTMLQDGMNPACLSSMHMYAIILLASKNVHISMIWLLEGAIRDHSGCIEVMDAFYEQVNAFALTYY